MCDSLVVISQFAASGPKGISCILHPVWPLADEVLTNLPFSSSSQKACVAWKPQAWGGTEKCSSLALKGNRLTLKDEGSWMKISEWRFSCFQQEFIVPTNKANVSSKCHLTHLIQFQKFTKCHVAQINAEGKRNPMDQLHQDCTTKRWLQPPLCPHPWHSTQLVFEAQSLHLL